MYVVIEYIMRSSLLRLLVLLLKVPSSRADEVEGCLDPAALNFDSLAQLHEHFEKGQLRLPAFVFAADERRQGGGASSRAEPPPPPSAAAERDLSAAERAQLRWGQQAAEVAAAPAPVLRAPSAPRTMTMARSGANVYSPLYDTGPLN